jgi:hypothetical protein
MTDDLFRGLKTSTNLRAWAWLSGLRRPSQLPVEVTEGVVVAITVGVAVRDGVAVAVAVSAG